MEEHVYRVMRPGIQAEHLHIHHMRHPGEWMPIALETRGERPSHVIEGQTATNVRVFDDVLEVVVVDERILMNGPVDDGGAQREHKTNEELPVLD